MQPTGWIGAILASRCRKKALSIYHYRSLQPAADAQGVGWPAGVVVGVHVWRFGLRAISPPPRPPRAAHPTPYPTTPRRASPPLSPRGYTPGARVTRIYRRWCGPPNPPLKPTPLRGPKTPAILQSDLDTNVIPMYHGGAA